MGLVPSKITDKWFIEGHPIFENFHYIFWNPLWKISKRPKGFSECTYFWISILVGFLFMKCIFVPIMLGLKFLLSPVGRRFSKIDAFLNDKLNWMMEEVTDFPGLGFIKLVCACVISIFLIFCVIVFTTMTCLLIHWWFTSLIQIPLAFFGFSYLAIGAVIWFICQVYKGKCRVEVFLDVWALISIIAILVICPDKLVAIGLGIWTGLKASFIFIGYVFKSMGLTIWGIKDIIGKAIMGLAGCSFVGWALYWIGRLIPESKSYSSSTTVKYTVDDIYRGLAICYAHHKKDGFCASIRYSIINYLEINHEIHPTLYSSLLNILKPKILQILIADKIDLDSDLQKKLIDSWSKIYPKLVTPFGRTRYTTVTVEDKLKSILGGDDAKRLVYALGNMESNIYVTYSSLKTLVENDKELKELLLVYDLESKTLFERDKSKRELRQCRADRADKVCCKITTILYQVLVRPFIVLGKGLGHGGVAIWVTLKGWKKGICEYKTFTYTTDKYK